MRANQGRRLRRATVGTYPPGVLSLGFVVFGVSIETRVGVRGRGSMCLQGAKTQDLSFTGIGNSRLLFPRAFARPAGPRLSLATSTKLTFLLGSGSRKTGSIEGDQSAAGHRAHDLPVQSQETRFVPRTRFERTLDRTHPREILEHLRECDAKIDFVVCSLLVLI